MTVWSAVCPVAQDVAQCKTAKYDNTEIDAVTEVYRSPAVVYNYGFPSINEFIDLNLQIFQL